MADERVVKVTLRAEMQSYLDGMERARKATSDTATEAQKLSAQKTAFDQLGRASFAAGGLIAVGLGVAVAKFAEFDQAMSNVQAATHETAANMESLRQAALDAGASTVFSATESANAIEELSKAGISTADILGGALAGSLDLAAAGGIAVADAAGIAATTMQQFGLEGDKAQHVADLLAAGAGKAMGDVTDLSAALKQSGLVANQFGVSVEETTGALAAFAANGLLGSDAGTSFRTMLLRLANPTDEVKDLMAELGIEAYNSQGQFVGLAGLAGELEDSLGGMTDQQKQTTLAMIFGQDAIRASTILLEEGEEGIRDWTTAVDDQGYAAETAATRLDNLKGDFEAFTGALDTALISMGEAADGPLRGLVQGLTNLVDSFNNLPSGAQQAVFWIGAIAAAGLTALGTYLLLVPKVAQFRIALDTLGPAAQRANRAIGALTRIGAVGAAVGIAALGVDYLANELSKNLLPSAAEVENKMRSAATGVDLFGAALNKEGITNTRQAGLLLGRLGKELDAVANSDFFNQASISGTAVTVSKSLASLAESDLPAAQAQFRKLSEDANLTDAQMVTFIETNSELKDALAKQANASGVAADSQGLLKLAMGDTQASAQTAATAYAAAATEVAELETALQDLITQVNTANGVGQDAVTSNAAWQSSLAGISQEIESQKAAFEEANGTLDGFNISLDANTESGSANAAMLSDVAASAQTAAEAQYQQDLTTMSADDATKKYSETLAAQRTKFEEAAVAAGFNADEVHALGDEVFALPDAKSIEILAATAAARKEIDEFVRTYDGKVITLQLTADQTQVGNAIYGGLRAEGLQADGKAGGGAIYGPGTGTSDTAGLYALSNGEHVWTKAEVDRVGGQAGMYAMRAAVMSGGLGGGGTTNNYAFHGQYAMTPADMFREAENSQRRSLWTAGVDV